MYIHIRKRVQVLSIPLQTERGSPPALVGGLLFGATAGRQPQERIGAAVREKAERVLAFLKAEAWELPGPSSEVHRSSPKTVPSPQAELHVGSWRQNGQLSMNSGLLESTVAGFEKAWA